MRLIKFPSIKQFHNVVRNVQHESQFMGIDEEGKVIMNRKAILPTLDFEGTVKLHGTHASVVISYQQDASVVISYQQDAWFQSRENIITPRKDNAGFAMFAHANLPLFKKIAIFALKDRTDAEDKDFAIFGEWCGKGIQKGVAISHLPKMFVIFGMAIVDMEGQKTYLTREEVANSIDSYKTAQIRSIYDFQTWEMKIDFENPKIHQNLLNSITEAVESECPVGKSLGVAGVGEGVVWRCVTPGYNDSGFWFKVKGKEHSKSKVRTLATVDVEKLQNIAVLAERVANNERLEQMHQKVFDTLNGGETKRTMMGDFIKAVMVDIFKEELDLIAASGFAGKDLNSPISKICKNFIMDKLGEFLNNK